MTVPVRRVWRAAPTTLVAVGAFVLASGGGVPALAYRLYAAEGAALIAAFLLVLAAVGLVFAWRYGLLPDLRTSEAGVSVRNPWRRYGFAWDDLTVVAPGENGLLVGSDRTVAEAWCVQKSRNAIRSGRRTRADRVAGEIYDVWEAVRAPVTDPDTGLTVRRARCDQAETLMQLERASSLARLGHVFPPDRYRYPRREIRRRWERVLLSRHSRVWLGERDGQPVGYLAYTADRVQHLGVHPDHVRRGYGSALLRFAVQDLRRLGSRRVSLWVIAANQVAVDFYTRAGWRETGQTRQAEFPPYPEEIEMTLEIEPGPR